VLLFKVSVVATSTAQTAEQMEKEIKENSGGGQAGDVSAVKTGFVSGL